MELKVCVLQRWGLKPPRKLVEGVLLGPNFVEYVGIMELQVRLLQRWGLKPPRKLVEGELSMA